MANVTLEKVTKIYPNGFEAVHAIDLEIRDGEFMVMVGPSGCAKSTTLRMLAGLESISGGKIYIGEKPVNNLAPKDRGIAMVFQNYALYPHMKVRENLGFGLKLAHVPKDQIEKQVMETAEILEIVPLLDRLPRQLSGGQAQRVAVGRAIIKKPSVFLFDEPLSNLDAKLRASMRVRISDLHKHLKTVNQSATTVYVTHDQTEAMTMGDRICVMKDGNIMQVDTPAKLYKSPANLFVAGFIGAPEMNFTDAIVARSENDAYQLQFNGQSVDIRGAKAEKIRANHEELVVFGIRPEFIHLADKKSPKEQTITGKIVRLENMGSEFYVYLEVDTKVFCAAISAQIVEERLINSEGSDVQLFIDTEQCHIFNKETGENVSL